MFLSRSLKGSSCLLQNQHTRQRVKVGNTVMKRGREIRNSRRYFFQHRAIGYLAKLTNIKFKKDKKNSIQKYVVSLQTLPLCYHNNILIVMMDSVKASEDTFPKLKQFYILVFLMQSKHISYVIFGKMFLLRKMINHAVYTNIVCLLLSRNIWYYSKLEVNWTL